MPDKKEGIIEAMIPLCESILESKMKMREILNKWHRQSLPVIIEKPKPDILPDK